MAGAHQRNTGPMRGSPRCGATTRRQTACEAPAVTGSQRCRMHGGNGRSGAPIGNKNAIKVGSAEALARLVRKYGPPTDDPSRLELDPVMPRPEPRSPSTNPELSSSAISAWWESQLSNTDAAEFLAMLRSEEENAFRRKR